MVSSTAVLDARDVRRRGQLYVAIAALAWSTAGVLQRELSVGMATQVAGRALFASFGLLAFVALSGEGGVGRAFRRMGRAELAVAALVAVSSVTFIIALNYTTVADVLFMQAVAPIAAALIAWAALRESVSRRTVVAMVVALVGVGVMVGGPGGSRGLGLSLSVVMMLTFAISLVITSHRRDVSMGPAMCLSQVLVLAVVGPFADPGTVSAHDLALMMLLGLGQMTLGLGFLMKGGRLLPAPEVALIALLEVVLAPLWVWLSISEQPSATTLAGGAVVVAAVVIQARAEPGTR